MIAAADGIARRDANGDVEFLATIPFDNTNPSADVPDPEAKTTSMTRSGNRILLVGNGSGPATVYVSDDAGATVRAVALPQAPDAEHPDQPRLIAADGPSVVATGYGGDWLTTWWSTDAGETWTAARLRTGSGQWLVDVVMRAGGGWHALGRVNNRTGPSLVVDERRRRQLDRSGHDSHGRGRDRRRDGRQGWRARARRGA